MMQFHGNKDAFCYNNAITSPLAAMSTGDAYDHRGGEENGEFCIAVAPATRTAGILTQLVKGTGC